jgi:hypothetical protein
MVNEKRLMFLASEVTIAEEDKLNPVFLSIKMKLADNAGNRNDEGITAAFISDLINRQDEFNGLPFYADVKKLIARKYDELGHMYNRITKKFGTTQIGSLVDFYSETDNDGVISLYATARVPKRENEICIRLVELYELGKLCCSFEVRYNPEDTIEKDGVLFIDASENNAMTGIALVSTPACVDAVALDMVAEVADDSDIVAECEEQTSERGETETMPKEMEMTAEVENKIAENTEETQEGTKTVIAEGEGASESGEGASESGAGASDSGAGASDSGAGASDSGAGASEGGSGDDSGTSDTTTEDAPVIDPDEDEKRANAETKEANAEVIEHSVDTHECVDNSGWYGDKPVHVIEYHERIIETMEDAGTVIAELENKIAELEEIKSKYDAIIAEQEAKVLAQKRECAKAFAEKQGLNVEDAAVAEAIEKLDYTKIAELTMAEAQDEVEEEAATQVITLASYVEVEVSDDKYGGLLSRKNK